METSTRVEVSKTKADGTQINQCGDLGKTTSSPIGEEVKPQKTNCHEAKLPFSGTKTALKRGALENHPREDFLKSKMETVKELGFTQKQSEQFFNGKV